jgi:hypothetical protein
MANVLTTNRGGIAPRLRLQAFIIASLGVGESRLNQMENHPNSDLQLDPDPTPLLAQRQRRIGFRLPV